MTKFSDVELLERASLRVAVFMRGMWEEKDSSDSRLLFDPWMPDRLTIVGRSRSCGDKVYREHVVPRVVIANTVHQMFRDGYDNEEVARYIRDHVKIVEISREEANRLDRRSELGLKTRMPTGWEIGGDIYARLKVAGIGWDEAAPDRNR